MRSTALFRYFNDLALIKRARSIGRLYLDRTTIARVAFSRCIHRTFCRPKWNDRPWNVRTHVCIIRPLVRFISGGSRIRGERAPLRAVPECPSDVIPWNHRGGVFSCVRISTGKESLIVCSFASVCSRTDDDASQRWECASYYKVGLFSAFSFTTLPFSLFFFFQNCKLKYLTEKWKCKIRRSTRM